METFDNRDIYRRKIPARECNVELTAFESVFKDTDYQRLKALNFYGYELTFDELKKRSLRLADAYHKEGICEGDTVGIATIGMPLVQENLLAISYLGATSKWIDLRIKGEDLIEKINESNCKVLVVFDGVLQEFDKIINETCVKKVLVASPKDYLSPFVRILANVKEGKKNVIPDTNLYCDYQKFVKGGNPNTELKCAKYEKDRPSFIVQSSGSTGKSKSIVHTEFNFNSAMKKEAASDLPLYKGKTMHISIPPFIIYGLCNSYYASLYFGMKGKMNPIINEEAVFPDIGTFDIACGAPVHYRYIYKKICELNSEIDFLSKQHDYKSKTMYFRKLRKLSYLIDNLQKTVLISGGDKIAPEELLEMERSFRTIIVNGYGNNELAGAAIVSPVYGSKPDSVGIPLKGVEVHAFNPETNEKLPDGETGEICVSSDNMFVAYINNDEETKRIKQFHDGKFWVHTGDLGHVDQDGFVYITGRNKRLIKRTNFKISPDTIENVIFNIDSVKDCVVVGVEDEADGSVPMAYIELKDKYKENENEALESIKNDLSSKLPDYEIPKYVLIIDKIPYQNNKRAFKQLEEKGNEYVKSLR